MGLFYSAARFRIIEGFPEPAEWFEVSETDDPDPLHTYQRVASHTQAAPQIQPQLSESFRLASPRKPTARELNTPAPTTSLCVCGVPGWGTGCGLAPFSLWGRGGPSWPPRPTSVLRRPRSGIPFQGERLEVFPGGPLVGKQRTMWSTGPARWPA
jgi:hypothetical protein